MKPKCECGKEGEKRRNCGVSIRNAYVDGSGAQKGDRTGEPWLPSAGRTEQVAADLSASTPKTRGEHPHTKAWDYRRTELREKSFQKIAGKTVESKTKINKFISYNSISSYSFFQLPGSLEMQ